MTTHRGFTLIEVILYVGLSSGVALALFGMLSILETSRVRIADATDRAAQASWALERMHRLYTGFVEAPDPGSSGTALVLRDGAQILVMDGVLRVVSSSGTEYLTTPDVVVSDFQVVHSGGPASRSLVDVTFTLMPALRSDSSIATASYHTSLYAF